MAKESGEIPDIFEAICTILENCCDDKNINIRKIPIFDLEILFLRLRAFSISNIEKFTGVDMEDNKEYPFLVNFNEIEVTFPEKKVSNKIEVSKGVFIVMRYPSASMYLSEELMNSIKKHGIYDLILDCIDNIFDGDVKLTYTKEELKIWIESLTIETHDKIKNFMFNMPSVEYTLNYKNSLGHDRKWVFKSLMDFFLYL